jgi:hypothetical protein
VAQMFAEASTSAAAHHLHLGMHRTQQQQRCNDRCLTMQTRVLISSWEKLEEEEEEEEEV